MLTEEHAIGLLVFIGFVFSIVVHECAHAVVASWCGDDTAKLLGRITLNPIPHIDPVMSVAMPLLLLFATGGHNVFGGAKPVPVNYYRLRHPSRDMMWVALAGPISNVLLAILFALAGNLLYFVKIWDLKLSIALYAAVAGIVQTNLVLACFNMLPIPPLDGSRVLAYLLPSDAAALLMQVERVGLAIVMLLAFSGILGPVFVPAGIGTDWLLHNLVFTI